MHTRRKKKLEEILLNHLEDKLQPQTPSNREQELNIQLEAAVEREQLLKCQLEVDQERVRKLERQLESDRVVAAERESRLHGHLRLLIESQGQENQQVIFI